MKKLSLLFVIISFFLSSIAFSSSRDIYMNKKYDVISIGKAMVDIIEYVSEEELISRMPKDFRKSDSNKIDKKTADNIFNSMKNRIIIPGGSEANIIVNIASLGGKTAFNSILVEDELGKLFRESLIKEKVDYLSPYAVNSLQSTARCFTFITPDKDRTFAVSADIIREINDNFIDYNAIENSKVFYTDASNLNHDGVQSEITIKALNIAKNNNTITAFNLNNNYYIENYREEIISLLPQIDIIMGGEKEAKNLFQLNGLDEVINKYLDHAKIVVITQGKAGAIIATKDSRIHVPIIKVKEEYIIDLNGAGDGFAAGFLYGYTHGYSLAGSGNIAAKTAAQIISQVGARPSKSLKEDVLN